MLKPVRAVDREEDEIDDKLLLPPSNSGAALVLVGALVLGFFVLLLPCLTLERLAPPVAGLGAV